MLMMSMNLSDIAILNTSGADYHCTISETSKNDNIDLLQNIDLSEKKSNIIKHKNVFSHVKICKEILTFADI